MPLVVLGICITLTPEGIDYVPDARKLAKWIRQIEQALKANRLCAGEASKLAGRLQWACQYAYKRAGRAMLYPLFAQQRRRSSAVGEELRLALKFWLEVLQRDLFQTVPWQKNVTKPLHLFCDARSTPPRVAAVLIGDQRTHYSDWEPTAEVMSCFRKRRDGQIMGLELLSIAFGSAPWHVVM